MNSEQQLQKHEEESSISDLVYRYLENVSYRDTLRRQRNSGWKKFRKHHARRKSLSKRRRSVLAEKYAKNPVEGADTRLNTNHVKSYISDALSLAIQVGYLTPVGSDKKYMQLDSALNLH